MNHTLEPSNTQHPKLKKQVFQHGANFYWYTLLPVLVALIYASTLATLPIDDFHDRENYFLYATKSFAIAEIYSVSYIRYLTNEPLWLFMNYTLYELVDSETIVRLFIFAPAFICAYLIGSKGRCPPLLLVVALLFPGIMQNYIVHIRQGVAISIFLIGFMSDNHRVRYLMFALAPFVHSAFFVISGVFVLALLLRRIPSLNAYHRFGIISIVLMILAALLNNLMTAADLRQVDEYQGLSVEYSGLGFMFWLFIFGLFIREGRQFLDRNMAQLAILLFYLIIYFLAPFAARLLECILIPLYISGLSLSPERKPLFIGAIMAFAMFFYYVNRDLYFFGWGL